MILQCDPIFVFESYIVYMGYTHTQSSMCIEKSGGIYTIIFIYSIEDLKWLSVSAFYF